MQKPKPGYKIIQTKFRGDVEIPESWNLSKLGNECKFEYGKSLTEENRDNEGFSVYGSGGIIGKNSKSFTKGPGIIIARKGSLGNVFLEKEDFWPIDTVFYISKSETNNHIPFMYYLLIYLKLEKYKIVTAHPGISRDEVYTILIKIPPFEDQRKIASILSNIDNLIDSYNDLISTSNKLKKGLMQQLFSKGIGHKKFQSITLFPRYDEERIPEEWNVNRVGKLLKIIDYRGRTPPFSKKGVIHLRSNNIRDGKINFENITFVTEETYEKYMTRGIPKEYDVLFTTEGPLGEVALVPKNFKFSLAQRIIVLRPKTKDIDSTFLKYLLLNRMVKDRYEGLSTGTTLGGIASKWFTKLFLMFPKDDNEQRKIASILSNIDAKIYDLESKKTSLENLKKGIMQKLLTGQIRIPNLLN